MQNASFQMSFNIGVGVGGFGRAVSEWVNKNYNSRTQSDLIIPSIPLSVFLRIAMRPWAQGYLVRQLGQLVDL